LFYIDGNQKAECERGIRIVQEIWDSIAEDQRFLGITEDQKNELGRRLARRQATPEECRSWDEIKKKFDVS